MVLGTVLSQKFSGEEHPIVYMSRKLIPAEWLYATVEWEAYALKRAIEELQYYLTRQHFTLVIDHDPLQWIAKAKDSNNRNLIFSLGTGLLFPGTSSSQGPPREYRWSVLEICALGPVSTSSWLVAEGEYCNDGGLVALAHKRASTPCHPEALLTTVVLKELQNLHYSFRRNSSALAPLFGSTGKHIVEGWGGPTQWGWSSIIGHLDDIKLCLIFSQASMVKHDTDAKLLSVSTSKLQY